MFLQSPRRFADANHWTGSDFLRLAKPGVVETGDHNSVEISRSLDER